MHEWVLEMVISRTGVLAADGVVLIVSVSLVILTFLLAEWRSVWPWQT